MAHTIEEYEKEKGDFNLISITNIFSPYITVEQCRKDIYSAS